MIGGYLHRGMPGDYLAHYLLLTRYTIDERQWQICTLFCTATVRLNLATNNR